MNTEKEMNLEVAKPSLIKMFSSPEKQFFLMKEKSKIYLPMITMILIQMICSIAITYLIYKEPNVSNQIEIIPGGLKTLLISTIIFTLISVTLTYFITAILYKVVMIFMGKDITYNKILHIVVYTSIISSLGLIINIILMYLFGGNKPEYTNLGLLFAPGTITHGIAVALDIFTIWKLIILILGFKIVANLNKKQTIIISLLITIISTSYTIIEAIISGLS
ncbi:hypothetical protein COF67_23750 [Bacillus toyonensis]|uniref:Yip1 family protein n=1 Tax=Bacillus toyonensis TaxID=155322 RepID=UPI000BFB34BE|nr:Yip1 family protein [Bacillus toyonensis]PHD45699.1 hypothetical protein COF67_23750 [Bacillus toyonensis]